jgi:hypothetical protein
VSVPWTPSGSVPRYPGGGDGRRKGLFRTNSVKEVQCLQNGETSNVNERRKSRDLNRAKGSWRPPSNGSLRSTRICVCISAYVVISSPRTHPSLTDSPQVPQHASHEDILRTVRLCLNSLRQGWCPCAPPTRPAATPSSGLRSCTCHVMFICYLVPSCYTYGDIRGPRQHAPGPL